MNPPRIGMATDQPATQPCSSGLSDVSYPTPRSRNSQVTPNKRPGLISARANNGRFNKGPYKEEFLVIGGVILDDSEEKEPFWEKTGFCGSGDISGFEIFFACRGILKRLAGLIGSLLQGDFR